MIEIKDYSFCYPGTDELALDGISLSISAGETVLIIGPSGCGKSTLLLAMNGVVPNLTGGKIKGRVFVDGEDTRVTPVATLASSVGLILQDPESQLTNLFVYDEVAFGPENLCLPEEAIRGRADRALEKSGLTDLKERSVFALSGGQKQRVAIAAALAMEPRTILLDNPTSNLDPVGAVETYRTICELRENDPEKTIILADHRPDHILPIVDRVVVMEKGRVISDGTPQEIYSREGEYLREEMGVFLPQVVDLSLQLRQAGHNLPTIPLLREEAVEVLEGFFSADIIEAKEPEPAIEKAPSSERVLELREVIFAYPNAVTAVDGVTLNVERGEFLCLVGQNGSGKSTLAKLMVGLLKATGGRIQFFGEDIQDIPLHNLFGRVGYVFQYPEHQFVANRVWDEVAFSLRALGVEEEEVHQRTEEMLEKFSLQEVKETSPRFLSKGQKRRLSVATMLITRPEVLILDEPMTGQDQKNIINLLEILNALRESGTTIIDITHDMEHVASYADRVVGMAQGKVVFDGPPVKMFLDPGTLEQLSLEPPAVVWLAEQLRERGMPIPREVDTIAELVAVTGKGEENL